MATVKFTNGLMTTVSSTHPTKNFDYQTKVGVRSSPGFVYGLLYFNIPDPIKRGATVTNAKSHLWVEKITESGTHTLTSDPLSAKTNFGRVTYATRPGVRTGRSRSASVSGVKSTPTEFVINVTADIQEVSDGLAFYGWRISGNLDPLVFIYAPNWSNPAYRPWIEYTYSEAPDKPTGLSPSGGRSVSPAKPVVRGTYVDVAGSTELQAMQVQIDDTLVFSAPWDSGAVLTGIPQLNLALTDYPGVPEGALRYWRMRLQDEAGLWSAWSDVASFKRDSKGTLVLTFPAASPDNLVNETTPPIVWSLTGETQTAYQLFLVETPTSTSNRDIKTTGKITSADNTHSLPAGWLDEPLKNYNLTVRVWDSKSRESTPGDPVFYDIVRTIYFAPTALTAPVTSLTATPLEPKPGVLLTIGRSATPDAFNVLRNGKVIDANIDPQDLYVSGSTYQYLDRGTSPYRNVVYEVQAVVNGKASSNNAKVTVNCKTSGVWLVSADEGVDIAVCLAGKEARNFDLAETSVVVSSLGTTNKMLVTQQLGGFEGVVSGSLIDVYGKTAEEWRAAFFWIRSHPGRKFYLTTGDYTMLVVVNEFTFAQRHVGEKMFDVSFHFYQQDSVSTIV